MKNIAYILLAATLLASSSCKDESYTGTLDMMSLDRVTLVTLSPNNPQLIADGRHELTFKVKAFMDVVHTRRIERIVDNQSVFFDSTYTVRAEVRADRIDPADIAITTSTGQTLDGLTFKTMQTGTVTFTAKYRGMTSAPQTVEMIAAPAAAYGERVIPVVFHKLVYAGNSKEYERYGTEYFQKILDKTNAVFAGTLAPDPLAVDSKIRFVLATHDPYGMELAEKGINRVELPATVKKMMDVENWMAEGAPTGGWIYDEVSGEWVDSGQPSSYDWTHRDQIIWDTERYLNVWCGGSFSVARPEYILSSSTIEIPGIGQGEGSVPPTPVDDEQAAFDNASSLYYYMGPAFCGLGISLVLTPGGPVSIAPELGSFFGLFATTVETERTSADESIYLRDDYCDDTPPDYSYRDQAGRETSVWVWGENPLLYNGPTVDFDKYNAMTSGGRASSFTPDQAARMRLVMENCPLRMMKQ